MGGEAVNGWIQRPVGAGEPEPEPESEASGLTTFIDGECHFEGCLRLRDSIRIDGEFRGEIVSQQDVIVGEGAALVAHIRARNVVILGAVAGDVTASRELVLRPSGRLQGQVETPCFVIERGAVFNGGSRMYRPDVSARRGEVRATGASAV